jgi:hypothetical protein
MLGLTGIRRCQVTPYLSGPLNSRKGELRPYQGGGEAVVLPVEDLVADTSDESVPAAEGGMAIRGAEE